MGRSLACLAFSFLYSSVALGQDPAKEVDADPPAISEDEVPAARSAPVAPTAVGSRGPVGGVGERVAVGMSFGAVGAELAESVGLDPPRGALVKSVTDGQSGAASGFLAGDIVLDFDENAIDSLDALTRAIEAVGDTVPAVRVVVWRDGEERVLSLRLREPAVDEAFDWADADSERAWPVRDHRERKSDERRPLRIGIGFTVAGAVLLVGGGILFAAGNAEPDRVAVCTNQNQPCRSASEGELKTFRTTGGVVMGVGGLAAVIGVIAFVVYGSAPSDDTLASAGRAFPTPLVGLDGVQLRWKF